MKDETVKYVVVKLLPGVWKREAIKQSLDRLHDNAFERQYEAMMKEKGLTPSQPKREFTRESLQPQRLFDNVKVKIMLPNEEPVVLPGHHMDRYLNRDVEMNSENDVKDKKTHHLDPQNQKEKKRKNQKVVNAQ